ncbi:MAG: hypothetical protein JNN15_18170, partial [Blastocatellia bacterium]|nr:hypothetical protein [Blastocatellia bacterium]
MGISDVFNKAKEVTDRAAEAGREKVKEAIDGTLAEIQSLRPVLSKCGFIVGDIGISLSIPPSFDVTIKQTGEGTTGLEELENDQNLTKLQSLVISSLKSTYALSGTFEKYGYFIGHLNIEVGIPPKVHV